MPVLGGGVHKGQRGWRYWLRTLPTHLIFSGFLGLVVSTPFTAAPQQPREEGAVCSLPPPPPGLCSTELNWEVDKKTGGAETWGLWKAGRWGVEGAAARASESRQKA